MPARGRSLATSLKIGDPARVECALPQQVAIDVVSDAFRGLAEVHQAGLVHRGLCPGRIFLGRGLRVKFSDFYLSRVSGAQTVAPVLSADADAGVPYRAPECRDGIAHASAASDVFSLALSLAGWLLGDLPPAPQVGNMRSGVEAMPIIGGILSACLGDP